MNNQWTGGQYSIFRGILGLFPAILALGGPDQAAPFYRWSIQLWGEAALPFSAALVVAGSMLLVMGKWDRLMALLLFFTLPLTPPPGLLVPLIHPLGFLLLYHLLNPRIPYGALSMVGRPDPGGNWILPPRLYALVWLFMGAMFAASLAGGLQGTTLSAGLLPAAGLLFTLSALSQKWRPLGWVLLAFLLPLFAYFGHQQHLAPYFLLHLAAFDPAWLAPQRGEQPELLFYDGSCGLCHRACRFVLAEDRQGDLFKMAPLQGDLFQTSVDAQTRAGLPDSLVLLCRDGRLLVKSEAVLTLATRLGGLWRPLAQIARLIPRPLRDGLYSGLAAIRHKLFKKPEQACPVVPPDLRRRFDW